MTVSKNKNRYNFLNFILEKLKTTFLGAYHMEKISPANRAGSFCSAEITANLVYFFPYDSSRKSARPTVIENCLQCACFDLFFFHGK